MKSHYVCCEECDEISRLPYPHRPGVYRCPNCRHTLFRYSPGMVEKLYALSFAALILFMITNLFPFLSFEVMGNKAEATFTTAFIYLYKEGDYLIALALLMTTLVVPAMRILLLLFLTGPIYHRIVPRYASTMLKIFEAITPWGMLDVFLVAILVSIVKLVKMGTIIPGTSLWAFGAMVFVLAYMQMIFDPHPLWDLIDRARGREPDLPRKSER
ncbi:paraquat-inducible protein A [Nitratifractor salsuginis]|uniref:Paraquat-inducible protein A n=1 Tax=Nitratifractor salsuginis (strain DSM 16511 / JCM 12458 / E9I37-1) TaxID=749222 RepID=E6X0T2_NITSE|nr:paraquat-inducible protein A [Nitratifractor salsuginis]ADV46864.1 Paraquat-inducible protein A [Nitratifractor salsuginis DSM 16511]